MSQGADDTAAVERVARDAYGKIVAIVARTTGDLHAAEDAVADALAAALTAWPRDGVPTRPEAWLVTTARRRLIDAKRRDARHQTLDGLAALTVEDTNVNPTIPDERLALLFMCAHPAIDPAARTPLMLRAVLGLELDRIASALLVSPSGLKQRLTRAKAKIRDAGIRLCVPEPEQLAARLQGVLVAIYTTLTAGVDAPPHEFDSTGRLASEAVHLAKIVCRLAPSEPEPLGLLALGLYCQSRRATRTDAAGAYVPLDEQDPARWDQSMIADAEAALRLATRSQRRGRFQLEASIQSAHVDRLRGGAATWRHVIGFYDLLVRVAPSVGADIGRAAALAAAGEPESALAALDALAAEYGRRLADCQPYWAVRGAVLVRLQRRQEASEALMQAIGLTADPAVRAYLTAKLEG